MGDMVEDGVFEVCCIPSILHMVMNQRTLVVDRRDEK